MTEPIVELLLMAVAGAAGKEGGREGGREGGMEGRRGSALLLKWRP